MAALQLIAMGSFLTVCLVVGVRMLLLARRTRELPELTIGVAFLLIGGLGYSLILASRWAQQAAPDWLAWTWGSALLAVDVGGVMMAASTWRIFRPDRIGATIWGLISVALAVSWVGHALGPGFDRLGFEGPWPWFGILGRPAVTVWGSAEAFVYAGKLRRQLSLGIGDPEIRRRCLGWAIAGVAMSGIYLRTAIAQAIGDFDPASRAAMTVNVLCGLVAAGAIVRAFLWKDRYRARVAAPTV